MRFDDQFITELKMKNDIADVIGQYVVLRRAGSRLNGLCPFHSEKTPSFTVFPDTSSYYCFGCGAGGDVITFIMNTEHLDYVDAVEFLAQRAHIPLPDEQDSDYKHTAAVRARQLEMNKLAARHFFETLKGPQGAPGRAYYAERGLSQSTITHFGLGYAADSFTELRDKLRAAGFSYEEAFEAGLLIQSKKNQKYYDKFRARVMFPVIDVRGDVVAFSGRVLDDSKPKYMNSPETLVYKKSQTVFGLNFAKQADGRIILVEGNIDVATLHQAGFSGAVAPLGTAFTKEQARLLAKYAKTVVVAFDLDKAGRKATDKAIGYLEEVGVSVRVLAMSGAKDPDEFIRKFGRDRFEMLLSGSKNPTQYALDKLRAQYDLSDLTGRSEYVKKAMNVLAPISSDIERELFCAALAKEVDLPAERVRVQVERIRKKGMAAAKETMVREGRQNEQRRMDRVNPERSANIRAAKAEEGLIALLCRNPDLAKSMQQQLPPEEFLTAFNRKVYAFFLERLQSGQPAESVLSAHFSPDEAARIMKIINTEFFGENREAQMQDYMRVLREEKRRGNDLGTLSPAQLEELINKRRENNGNIG